MEGRQHFQVEELNMLKFVTRLLISGSFFLAALAPASAMPIKAQNPAPAIGAPAEVVEVHYKHRRGFYRHHKRYYYNGHRGYRHHRHGYRHYNGYWFPPSAFSFGIIIGRSGGGYGVRPGYTHPRHIRYCYNRYRSYRHHDNTFQPYHGPRRQCRSRYY
jgi:hypothetical protein